MSLLDAPIKWSANAKIKRIYHLLGDDDLFDDIDRAKDDKSQDIRPLIVKHLPRLLNTRTWSKKPDEETEFAIGMLRRKAAAFKAE